MLYISKSDIKMYLESLKNKRKQGGFTLIEILIVVALIAILATVVFVALNPAKNFADTRNATRNSDASNLATAITLYLTTEGKSMSLLEGSTVNAIAVCNTAGDSWSDIVDSATTTATTQVNLNNTQLVDEFLTKVPRDPQTPTGIDTGYDICKSANGRITVKAPLAENGKTIEVKR